MTEDSASVKSSGNQSRLHQAFARAEGAFERTAKILRNLALLEILDQLSRVSIVVVAVVYVLEADDRRREGVYRAWQIVNTAQDTQASGGRVEALEDLVRNGVSLARIKLDRVSLRGATLNGADLSDARLGGADLSGSKLRGVNLSGADLGQTNLSGADLAGARVVNVSWGHADLKGANLAGVDMTGATVAPPHTPGSGYFIAGGFLTQDMLDEACGDESTKVPEGLRKPKQCGK